MATIDINELGSHEYDVSVGDGGAVTRHRVRVPPRLRDDLGLSADDERRLVHESFEFLLEREPASAILGEFTLDTISRYFPEYDAEIRSRVA